MTPSKKPSLKRTLSLPAEPSHDDEELRAPVRRVVSLEALSGTPPAPEENAIQAPPRQLAPAVGGQARVVREHRRLVVGQRPLDSNPGELFLCRICMTNALVCRGIECVFCNQLMACSKCVKVLAVYMLLGRIRNRTPCCQRAVHVTIQLIRLYDVEDYMSIEHRKGDLFVIADETDFKDFALAHCISEDCRMGRGIAVEFKNRFGHVEDLKQQVANGKGTGTACILKPDRVIYYLITKVRCFEKPTYTSLQNSLVDMRSSIADLGVNGVVMPRIGCGLDGLQWVRVEKMLKDVFKNTDLKIVVCSL